MAEKENQQEQILSQTKSLYQKVAGNSELAKGVESAVTNFKEVATDAVMGVTKGAIDITKVAGTGATIPGVAVEKTGDFVGGVMKAPGEGLKKATNLVGNIANAPGALVQGAGDFIGKGVEATGQVLGAGTEALLGKTAGDFVKGSYKLGGDLVKGATGIVGGVMKAPGELIKGVGNFTGEVLKLPGNLFQRATKILGGVLKAPGEILQGIAKGTENLVFKTKNGVPTLNGAEIALKGPQMSSKDLIRALGTGEMLEQAKKAQELGLNGGLGGAFPVFIYGNELNKMDNFAKNMSTLANGKEGPDKPFSSILTKPKSERAAAVKEATVQLRSDLHKIKDRLEKDPGSFTPQQQAELKVVMKGIEQQGGIDKYMAKNFDLPENYQNKEKINDMVKDAKEHTDKGREGMKKQVDSIEKDATEQNKENKEKFGGDSKESKPLTPQEKLDEMTKNAEKSAEKGKSGLKKQIESIQKDTKDKTNALKDKQSPSAGDKDVKPVISGNAPKVQAPTKSINGIGR